MATTMLVTHRDVLEKRYLSDEMSFQAMTRWQQQRAKPLPIAVMLIETQQPRLERVLSRFLGVLFSR
jgi:Mlc titration factor MtfA (ptsG expression regulator)